MNKYQFQLLTSTGLGHEYFYCYGRDDFEKWLKRKNIKYKIDKRSTNIFDEKDKEIERLNNGCKELKQQIDDLYKLETTLTNENDRLNNIINELEKDLDYEINDYNGNIEIEEETLSGEFLRGSAFEADYLKSRLKALKGE